MRKRHLAQVQAIRANYSDYEFGLMEFSTVDKFTLVMLFKYKIKRFVSNIFVFELRRVCIYCQHRAELCAGIFMCFLWVI